MAEKDKSGTFKKKIQTLEAEVSRLRREAFHYRELFRNFPEVIVFVDPRGRILEVNDQVKEWLGYDPDEIRGKQFTELELWDEKTRALLREKFSLRLRGETVPPYAIEVRSKSGALIIGKVVAQSIRNAEGDVEGSLTLFSDITSQSDQALRFKEASDRNLALFRAIPDMIFITDRDGTYVEFKADREEELAIPREQIIGRNINETGFPEETLSQMKANMKAAFETGELRKFEYQLETPPGRGIFECRMVPLNENELLSIIRNITERKNIENRLKDSEKRYRALLEENIDAVFIFDLNGILKEVNHKALEMFGYFQEEVIGSHLSKLVAEREKKDSRNRISALLNGGVLPVYERIFVKKDGTEFSGEISVSLVKDSTATPSHFQSFVRDITGRKQAALEAQKRQDYLESFLRAIPEAIIALDSEHGILEWNPGAEKLFGYSREEVMGKNIDSLITDPITIKEAEEFTKRVFSGKNVYPKETIRCRKDGTHVQVLLSGSPIIIHGKLQGVVAIYIDISAQKKIEEELKKADKLESLALLAGGIAHDFNNILGSISINLELFGIYEDNPAKMREKIKKIELALASAQKLTMQLLTFSTGTTPVKKAVMLNRLITDTAHFSLSGSNVKCMMEIPDHLWPSEIDAGQIGQVIQNIVINAVQAMPGGGILRITAKNVQGDDLTGLPLNKDKYIRMEFRDQGIGIPKQHLENIFDPFFTTKQKGGGLGLSTAFSIIKNHDGLITVESEMGKFTSFSIYLPALEERVEVEPEEKKEVVKGSGKVLLMDDDPMILGATGEFLKRIGYRVVTAEGGEEAIRNYRQAMDSDDPFDCVILDLTIPDGIGGEETLRELVKTDPDIKAIASSGYSVDPIISEYKSYGFSGSISKPYSIRTLAKMLEEVISGSEKPDHTD